MSRVRTEVEFVVEDENGTVTVRKIRTAKGHRLEVDPGSGDRIRIDALGLESLSWQGEEFVSELVDGDHPIKQLASYDDSVIASEESVMISNEYADANVRKLRTPDGDRLVIEGPKKGGAILADTAFLNALARQSTGIFSEFLATPHGPEELH